MRFLFIWWAFMLVVFTTGAQDRVLNVIVIGAHPDDPDGDAGGTAILFAKMGHRVKFLSVTNGDAGHHEMGGGMLAKIRREEAKEAGKRFGIVEYEVLDNHDGGLEPNLEVRLDIIRRIRQWNADVVIAPRPNDYHPDHRYTGILVQDASYLVIVPNVAPDTPPLKKNPVFLYCQDYFQRPNPFKPDIAVGIDEVFDQKIYAMAGHKSQYFEWLPWTMGRLNEVPADEKERLTWLAGWYNRDLLPEVKSSLEKWYGKEKASKFKKAEAFEICEYGYQPNEKEIRDLFPMLGR